ncbi:hypothetical protein E2C01_047516 [Portunus trituberculatus]|uniref:Uncharacterized protein n=1 Tax=Portunus trituberculatus TaxID=210409 RepID=A0A5B7G854_PORTR|nr:hypothetical protein [Portunus trituberculatus]
MRFTPTIFLFLQSPGHVSDASPSPHHRLENIGSAPQAQPRITYRTKSRLALPAAPHSVMLPQLRHARHPASPARQPRVQGPLSWQAAALVSRLLK